NIGCIPSKALLHASELFEEAGHGFKALGIDIPAPVLNLPQMMAHKSETVAANVGGVDYLFKKNKITTLRGIGTIVAPGKVLVTPQSGPATEYETKNIVIATGSVSAGLPGIEIDEKTIVSSTGALTLEKVPRSEERRGGKECRAGRAAAHDQGATGAKLQRLSRRA